MYVGKPTHRPGIPDYFAVLAIASKIFLNGSFPFSSGFYAYNLVFALSNGKLIVAATAPARKVARAHERFK